MAKTIPLTKGYVAIVDDDDYEWLSQFKWQVAFSHRNVYAVRTARRNGARRKIWMHRAIMDAPETSEVDHINRNGIDNRRSNLRLATPSQNKRNRAARPGARFKGVTRQHNRFAAAIQVDGSRITIGYFETETEAAAAYNIAARQYHGEFAWLNDVDESVLRQDLINADGVGRPLRANNTTGFRGVFRSYKDRYAAMITHGGKQRYIGYFKSARDAALAYNEVAKTIFGDRAWLNKVE